MMWNNITGSTATNETGLFFAISLICAGVMAREIFSVFLGLLNAGSDDVEYPDLNGEIEYHMRPIESESDEEETSTEREDDLEETSSETKDDPVVGTSSGMKDDLARRSSWNDPTGETSVSNETLN